MKVGDKIRITNVDPQDYEFFEVGDIAYLSYEAEDGLWWADFPDYDKEWCVNQYNSEFEPVE